MSAAHVCEVCGPCWPLVCEVCGETDDLLNRPPMPGDRCFEHSGNADDEAAQLQAGRIKGLELVVGNLNAALSEAHADLQQAREVLLILAGLASCGGEVAARLMDADFGLEGLTYGQVDALTSQAIRVRSLPDADIAAALRFALGGR